MSKLDKLVIEAIENSPMGKRIEFQLMDDTEIRINNSYPPKSMISRCYNQNHTSYKDYGERGITVCDSWLDSFENFYEDMDSRPNGYSLDRIDNSGNYDQSNCKWGTPKEQSRNQRSNVIENMQEAENIRTLNSQGIKKKDIAEQFKCSIATIYDIVGNRSWQKDELRGNNA
jgi:hypothetical protein